jgi:tRNA dimethylallyltransferase
VFRLTGQPLSALQGRREGETLGSTIAIALVPEDRARLHDAIARRFDAMLDAGLVDEVRSLRIRYALTPSMPSMRCVGYRQAWDFIDGTIDAKALREQGIAATRQLAKRQLTWLRTLPATAFEPTSATLVRDVGAFVAGKADSAAAAMQ